MTNNEIPDGPVNKTTDGDGLAAEVGELLASMGSAYDGGSPDTRADIAEEWVDAFGDEPDALSLISIMAEAGYWDANIARDVYNHVNDPAYYLEDQVEELHDKIGPVWERQDPNGMSVAYALCNRDADLDKLVETADAEED